MDGERRTDDASAAEAVTAALALCWRARVAKALRGVLRSIKQRGEGYAVWTRSGELALTLLRPPAWHAHGQGVKVAQWVRTVERLVLLVVAQHPPDKDPYDHPGFGVEHLVGDVQRALSLARSLDVPDHAAAAGELAARAAVPRDRMQAGECASRTAARRAEGAR